MTVPPMPEPAADAHTEGFVDRVLSRMSSVGRGHNVADDEESLDNSLDWDNMPEVQAIKQPRDGTTAVERRLGVTWSELTIKGLAADSLFNENVLSQFLPGKLKGSHGTPKSLRSIIDKSSGCVKPGEMLLVLGRPGAGCTSLLRVLANQRAGFTDVEGEVHYGSLNHKETQKYKGQIVMNTEEETFFPTLTAQQTIDFATRMTVPYRHPGTYASHEEARKATRDFFFHMLGVSHTRKRPVGNEYIRGVSGGERKRISILEAMATRGSVYCWDNSTRGLDANTALQYVKAVRKMTDLFGLSSVMTLYQAGNGIHELFYKVLVLDQGQQIFYGPLKEARPFMHNLGFICANGANVADFLTGVTVPTEREIRPGFEIAFPKTVRIKPQIT